METIDKVVQLMELLIQLRDPQLGCPWSQQQTFDSLLPLTIEEVYELADAIERQNNQDIADELGDLLYHLLFYCQIGDEQSQFDLNTIAQRMLDKQHNRQQHNATDAKQAHQHWQQQKAKEKPHSRHLDQVTHNLPALNHALKLQNAASLVGFDWQKTAPVFDKLKEEIDELKTAIEHAEIKQQTEEMGDILFTCINLARLLNIHPEQALRQANIKFQRRFNYIEETLATQKKSLTEASLEQMEALWCQAKNMEKEEKL